MALKKQLESDLLKAMREKNDLRKNVLRLILTTIKLTEIERGKMIEDNDVLSILQKELKTRREVIEESQKAARGDLQKIAEDELDVINEYLPVPLTDTELEEIITRSIHSLNASDLKDSGKVIKDVITTVQGRAENEKISRYVREILLKNA